MISVSVSKQVLSWFCTGPHFGVHTNNTGSELVGVWNGPQMIIIFVVFLDFLCDYSIVYFLFSVCLMCMNWMVGKRTIATPLNWSASLILWHGWQVTNSWRLFLHYQVNIVLASWKNGNKIANIKKILDIYIIYFYFLLVLLFCQPGFFISVFY